MAVSFAYFVAIAKAPCYNILAAMSAIAVQCSPRVPGLIQETSSCVTPLNADYRGATFDPPHGLGQQGSSLTRGHLNPNAINGYSTAVVPGKPFASQLATFSMLNVIPQSRQNNVDWAWCENAVALVAHYLGAEARIVTGATAFQSRQHILNRHGQPTTIHEPQLIWTAACITKGGANHFLGMTSILGGATCTLQQDRGDFLRAVRLEPTSSFVAGCLIVDTPIQNFVRAYLALKQQSAPASAADASATTLARVSPIGMFPKGAGLEARLLTNVRQSPLVR